MNVKRFLTIVVLFISACVWSQTKLIEKVEKTGDEIVIPYYKYELENGLTLIVHEDQSDPLVHVDVTYHVGSAREELNKSGFAHFFEHMMFQGSENVADEEHFKIVTNAGGTLNGSTNRDRTNYYQTVPSNQLDLMLWLESDRMGFFLDAVTQEKFEIQRSTVKNEKGQNYDNRPYGKLWEVKDASLYPYGHPYSWLTIGKLEDLDRVDVDDLKKFFMRWYGPNNATLTVGGSVDHTEVVKLAEKYFGVIPAGPVVEPLKLDAFSLQEDRYVSYIDSNIRFPALIFVYPTVPRFHPDQAALDCLAEIIGVGQNSFMFKKFVKTQKAIQSSSFNFSDELAGEMGLFVIPYPGGTLTDFENEMKEVLAEFENSGVTDNDILKFKANWESNRVNSLASVSGKVSTLASYETFIGNPNYIKNDFERYLAVTKEDVIRVYNKYVKGRGKVVLSVIPKDGSLPARPDNYQVNKEGGNKYPITDYSGLSYIRPTGDTFDRSQRPVPGASPLVSIPEFWTSNLDNGIKIIGTETDEIPMVALQISINGGHKMDYYNQSKSGTAALTASLMNESTENYTSAEIQEELRKIGSSVNVYADENRTVMNVNSLKKNIGKTVEIIEEMLYRPKFKQEDFDRLKKEQLEGVLANKKDPSIIADEVFRKLIYGEDHVYAVPTYGSENSVKNISLDDVKNFYNNYYDPRLSEVVVVGDISEGEILSHMDFLKRWESKSAKIPDLPEMNKVDNTTVFLVDKKDAPQSEIRIGTNVDLTYDVTGPYFKSNLMNYPLGGAFNSRINLNLREDKGWTYGARSYFDVSEDGGMYMARAGVKADATDGAVYEFMKEMTNYQEDGIADEELEFMRNSIGQRDARSYETPSQKSNFLRRIVHYDLDRNYVEEQTNIINTITKEEINALAKEHLKVDRMSILVVGDKESNLEKLNKLGYKVVELDENGKPKEEKTEEIKN